MQVELTVRRAGRSADVAIHAAEQVPLAALRAQLAHVAGISADTQLWHGPQLLAETAMVGAALRHGAVVDAGSSGDRRPVDGVLALHQVGGPGAGRVVALNRGRIVLGRHRDCEIVLADADSSRRHAVVEVTSAAITVVDLGSTNGTTVDGDPVPSSGRSIRPGQLIRIGDSTFTLATPTATPAATTDSGDGLMRLMRPPRRAPTGAVAEIVMPVSPTSTRPRGVQWVAAIIPAAAGGAIAWATQSAQFLLFALLSPVMLLSTSLGDRVHWRRSRRREAASYTERRAAADAQIAEALLAETAARRDRAPDPATVGRTTALPGTRLWERGRRDGDFMVVRLGTATRPSILQRREGSTVVPAGAVVAVPVCVDLRRGPLGVAAPALVLAGIGRWLVGQLAALHSPADLELVLLVSDGDAWQWSRWLPHLRGRIATTSAEWGHLVAELTGDLDRQLAARRLDPQGWTGPWRVLVVDRAARLADVAGLAALLARGCVAGVTSVCLDEDPSALPTACGSVVRVTGVTGSRAIVEAADTPGVLDVVLDDVSAPWADDLARDLAPILDAGADDTAVPASCSLVDVLELDPSPDAITRRWSGSDGGAGTSIGLGADGPCRIDLTADGPHALIAGTTGSGKSELLRAFVTGLAADHPPDLLNFLLVDYKGGAAFAECADLPHTCGLVTDLDPFLTTRALRSLDSELRHRERLFADAEASDLVSYRSAAPGQPLARLVIVVDEFATLAEELPDFVRGLVGVAQRGRSLGVHLVLATQRPGSAVTPEIRANTSLRIALRVTDPAESSDVLDAPDAAFIDRAHPGRAILRTGSTLVTFQTAHAGYAAPAAAEATVDLLDAWRRPLAGARREADGPTDLERLVTAVRRAHEASGRPAVRSAWMAPLEERISRTSGERPVGPGATDTLDGPARPERCRVDYAVVDLPDEQRRAVMQFDLDAGSSLLAAGAARSGRTELLVSLALGAAERLRPDELHLYVIDSAGPLSTALAPLPHCATVLRPGDLHLAPTLLRRLDRRCTDAAAARPGPATARSLLLIDGWDGLSTMLPDAEALECADLLAGVLRNGPRAATSVAVSGGRTVLAPRLAAQFETRIALRLADAADYGMAGIPARSVPARLPPGRGVRTTDAAELQIICASSHDGPGAAADAVAAACSAQAWPRRAVRANQTAPHAPLRLRSIPSRVDFGDLPSGDGRTFWLGLGGDDASPVGADLFAGDRRFLVAGPPRSGRSTALRSILFQANRAGVPAVVAAPSRSPLCAAARTAHVDVISPDDHPDIVAVALSGASLVLVDDCESFTDSPAGDAVLAAVRGAPTPPVLVVAGRNDDLATSYRGIGAFVRRSNCGLLLRPGPVDGELLGVRLPRRPSSGPPGRGVLVGEPSLGACFADGEPLPVQVVLPPDVDGGTATSAPALPGRLAADERSTVGR